MFRPKIPFRTALADRRVSSHARAMDALECRRLLSTAAASLIEHESSTPSQATSYPPVFVDGQLVYPNCGPTGTDAEIYNIATNQWSITDIGHNLGNTSAVVGDEAVFAGGFGYSTDENPNIPGNTQVDIYNAANGQWSIAQLSSPRIDMTTVTDGSKVLFAGGDAALTFLVAPPVSNVDIYNASNNQWSTASLSVARDGFAAVSVDGQAIFAGGDADTTSSPLSGAPSDVVDIYDNATDQWSTAQLSQPMGQIAAATDGNYAFFVDTSGASPTGQAGAGNVVDIYNASTGSWTVASLSQRRSQVAVVVIGQEVLFLGGYYTSRKSGISYNSTVVDIFNIQSGKWSTTSIPADISTSQSAVLGNLALFTGFDQDDLEGTAYSAFTFNAATNQWSVVPLPGPYRDQNDDQQQPPEVFAVDGEFVLSGGGQLPDLIYAPTTSAAPVNQAPTNAFTSDTPPAVFRWTPVPGATSYTVYLDRHAVATVTDNRWAPGSSVDLSNGNSWYVAATIDGGVLPGLETTFTDVLPSEQADLTSWTLRGEVSPGTKATADATFYISSLANPPSSVTLALYLVGDYGFQNGNVLLGSTTVPFDAADEEWTRQVTIPITVPQGLYPHVRYYPEFTLRIRGHFDVLYPMTSVLSLVISRKSNILSLPLPTGQ